MKTAEKAKAKIDVQWHFATPVYAAVLDGHEQRRKAFIKLIMDEKAKHPGIKKSNQNAWHSENNLHHWNDDNVRWLNKQIGEFGMTCLKNFGKMPPRFDLVLHSAWANVCGVGGWNAPHNHIPNHWSGVYYINVEEPGPPPDKGDKSGMIEFLNPIQLGSFFGLPTGISYRPKNGQIFFFHSALMHLVHPHFTDFDRISIAFNLDVIPGKPSGKSY